MATVRNLAVEITANASKLRSEVASSQRTIQGFARTAVSRIGAVAKAVTGLGLAAAGMFAAFGVLGLRELNKVSAEIDEMVKAAGNLRFEVGDLQELRFIAEQTGTSVGQMQRSIQFMNRQLANESEKTAQALRGIGFSIDQVMAMSPAERFKTIASALSDIEDEGQQTAAMMELFGRTGGDMLNLINANFEELGDTFERFGIRLSVEQGKAVEAYQDAKNRLGTLFEGFKMQMTANLAPVMTDILKFIEDFIEGAGGMDVVANRAAAGVLEGIIAMIDGLSTLLDTIDAVAIGWQSIMQGGRNVLGVGAMGVEGYYGLLGDNPISRHAGMFKESAFETANQAGANVQGIRDRREGREESVDRARDFIQKHVDGLEETANAMERMDSQLESLFTSNQSLFGIIPDKFDAIVEKLSQQNEQASVKVDLNLTTDKGQLKGEIIASPEMARAMQQIAAREINNTARGVAA